VWNIPKNVTRYLYIYIYIYIYIYCDGNSSRKCVRCRKILESIYYIGELNTCNTWLEKSKEQYATNREIMIQRSKGYIIKNNEK
jgi:hypothetical protein